MEYKGLKIGIFTITDAINYGAFFQMFAFARYLSAGGADVTVYHCGNSIRRNFVKYFSYSPVRQYRKIMLLSSYLRDRSAIKVAKYNGEKLDVAMLGSDEIWNLQNDSFDRFGQYYGLGLNSKKIIAYAPSIGFADPEFLINDIKFVEGLNNIDTILVRDQSTRYVAERITSTAIEQVVDPTILFDDWSAVGVDAPILDCNYILFYGYSSDPPFKRVLLDFAKSRGLKVISAGHHTHEWCDKNYPASPFEFLQLIRCAEFVFTSTFHGTVLATLLNKQFCYFGSGQKVVDFGEKFGLTESHIDETSSIIDVERSLTVDVSPRRILLTEYRDKSRNLLRQAVGDLR